MSRSIIDYTTTTTATTAAAAAAAAATTTIITTITTTTCNGKKNPTLESVTGRMISVNQSTSSLRRFASGQLPTMNWPWRLLIAGPVQAITK